MKQVLPKLRRPTTRFVAADFVRFGAELEATEDVTSFEGCRVLVVLVDEEEEEDASWLLLSLEMVLFRGRSLLARDWGITSSAQPESTLPTVVMVLELLLFDDLVPGTTTPGVLLCPLSCGTF